MSPELEFALSVLEKQGLGEPWRKRVLRRYCEAPNAADWRFIAGTPVVNGPAGRHSLVDVLRKYTDYQGLPPYNNGECPTPEQICSALTMALMGG